MDGSFTQHTGCRACLIAREVEPGAGWSMLPEGVPGHGDPCSTDLDEGQDVRQPRLRPSSAYRSCVRRNLRCDRGIAKMSVSSYSTWEFRLISYDVPCTANLPYISLPCFGNRR